MKNKYSKKMIFILLISMAMILCSCKAADSSDKYKNLEECANKRIGVKTGTLYEEEFLKKFPGADICYLTDTSDSIIALTQKRIDAYLIEESVFNIEKMTWPGLYIVGDSVTSSEIVMGVGTVSNQEALLEEINEYIDECNSNGSLKKLQDKWFDEFNIEETGLDEYSFSGENGRLSVAMESANLPFSYYKNGKFIGYDVEFVMGFCQKYGYIPDIAMVNADSIAPGLAAGKYDLGPDIFAQEHKEDNDLKFSKAFDVQPVRLIAYESEDENGNFFDRVASSFRKTFIKDSRWKMFLKGILMTLKIVLLSIIFGTILGYNYYIICRKKKRLQKAANAINWVLKGFPTVVLLMIFYYLIFGSTPLGGDVVAIICFTILFAASVYGLLEMGMEAVGTGQLEAARAQGFTDRQAVRTILLKQAAQYALPAYLDEIIGLINDSSIVGYIAVADLTRMSDIVRSNTFGAFFPLIAISLLYFGIIGIMTFIIKRIQRIIDPQNRSNEKIMKGITKK